MKNTEIKRVMRIIGGISIIMSPWNGINSERGYIPLTVNNQLFSL